MKKKIIPKLFSFETPVEKYFEIAKENRLLRLGVKVNTPTVCNWACPYCYAGSEENEKRPKVNENMYYKGIDPYKDSNWIQKMKKWIKQSMELGVNTVTINGTFEPATSPYLFEIIKFCKENKINTTLVTNGTLFTDEQWKILYDLEICLLVKMNVPMVEENDKDYEKYCRIQKELSGRKGNEKTIYKQQKDLIEKLIKLGFNQKIEGNFTRLGVESIIASNNIKYLPKLVRQLREKNIYSHIEVIKLQGFATNNPILQVTKAQIKELFEKILEDDIKNGFEKWDVKPPYVAGTCYQNLIRVDMKADGSIAPCPGIDIILGNMNEKELKDILKNENLYIIRNLDKYIQGDCKKCELFNSKSCYGGCRGTVYQTLLQKGLDKYECLVGSDPSCYRVKKVLDNGLSSDIFK